MPLTKALGQFVADLSPNRLPEGAVQVAQLGFIDCIGTMIAGRNEDCVRILKQVLNPSEGPATRAGQGDLREELRFGDPDFGVRGDQDLFGFANIRPALQ